MRKITFWMVVFSLMLVQGCMKNEGDPVGSDQIMPSYSPVLKDCLRKCQVKHADQLDDGNDRRRECACDCHKTYGSVSGPVGPYCQSSQDGILQSSNADTLTDMKSKGGGW